MDILQDLKLVYSKSLKNCKELLIKNPLVLLLPIVFSLLINFLLGEFLAPFIGFTSILSGLIYGLIYSCILSIYFSSMSDLIYYRRIRLASILNLNSGLYYLMNIYFVYVISSWLNLFAGSFSIISIILFLLFNCLPESIYVKDKQYIEAFTYSFSFIKENILHWIIPMIAYLAISSLIFSPNLVAAAIQVQNYVSINLGLDIPIYALTDLNNIIRIILFYIFTGIYAIFRPVLFKILSESTLRKRKYMGTV